MSKLQEPLSLAIKSSPMKVSSTWIEIVSMNVKPLKTRERTGNLKEAYNTQREHKATLTSRPKCRDPDGKRKSVSP